MRQIAVARCKGKPVGGNSILFRLYLESVVPLCRVSLEYLVLGDNPRPARFVDHNREVLSQKGRA